VLLRREALHASDVRGFTAWLDGGRVVRKGQQGFRIVAPVMDRSGESARVVTITPASVIDITQTAALPVREAARVSVPTHQPPSLC
jgi:hypothetical protein